MGNLLADFCINLLDFEKKELILQRKGDDSQLLALWVKFAEFICAESVILRRNSRYTTLVRIFRLSE